MEAWNRRWRDEDLATMRAMRARGASYLDIALHFGVSKNVVVGVALRHGLDEGPVETLSDRMDALDARMDQVLRECPPGFGMVAVPRKKPGVATGMVWR